MNRPIVVLFSGGLDSTVLLTKTQEKMKEEPKSSLFALSIYYEQRHDKEIECAKNVVAFLNSCACPPTIQHVILYLPLQPIWQYATDRSLVGSAEVPHSEYEDNPMNTYVPSRNALFLSLAMCLAASIDAEKILVAAHANDAIGPVYPDCRPAFFEQMETALNLGISGYVNPGGVWIRVPFNRLTKAEVVEAGVRCNAPFGLSWSCYEGGEYHCGVCPTCRERMAAFNQAEYPDPTTYAINATET